MKKLIFKIKCLFRVRKLNHLIKVNSLAEIPDELKKNIYVVGKEKSKWVIFNCPCKCGNKIQANLMMSQLPAWKLTTSEKTATLYPSISVHRFPCRSHFWLHKNKILWVYDG